MLTRAMERRKPSSSKAKTGIAGAKKRGRKLPKKAPKVDIAKTALGEEPKKRGLKKTATKTKQKSAQGGQREMTVQVKRGRYLKHSSTLWLHRQLNDPYVAKAKAEGYRSRAAYKLIELNEKYDFLKKGARVVDLGAAPGGWCQVAVKEGAGQVIGIDYLGVDTVAGAEILEMDFLDDDAPDRLKALMNGMADVVLSDMAAPTTGHKSTDHLRIVSLADAALDFAMDVLNPGGTFVSKVFAGGAEGDLLKLLKLNFTTVKHAKPKASRSDSSEKYVVAIGFKGKPQE